MHFILVVILSSYQVVSFHILPNNINSGKVSNIVQYRPMDDFYSFHIKFCYSYLNSCKSVN
jgi:hypothetical protein